MKIFNFICILIKIFCEIKALKSGPHFFKEIASNYFDFQGEMLLFLAEKMYHFVVLS